MNEVTLRPIELSDSTWAFLLMNQPHIRKASFSSEKISQRVNRAYWKRKLGRKGFEAHAIELDNRPVGLIRIENKTVSIAVGKEFQHKGIASQALSLLDLNNCVAEIKTGNLKSIKLFKRLGFKLKNLTFEKKGGEN